MRASRLLIVLAGLLLSSGCVVERCQKEGAVCPVDDLKIDGSLRLPLSAGGYVLSGQYFEPGMSASLVQGTVRVDVAPALLRDGDSTHLRIQVPDMHRFVPGAATLEVTKGETLSFPFPVQLYGFVSSGRTVRIQGQRLVALGVTATSSGPMVTTFEAYMDLDLKALRQGIWRYEAFGNYTRAYDRLSTEATAAIGAHTALVLDKDQWSTCDLSKFLSGCAPLTLADPLRLITPSGQVLAAYPAPAAASARADLLALTDQPPPTGPPPPVGSTYQAILPGPQGAATLVIHRGESGLMLLQNGPPDSTGLGGVRRASSTLAAGDVDGDGLLDVVFFGDDRQLWLALGVADGSFNHVALPWDQSAPVVVALSLSDLDGDGHLDLVVGSANEYTILYQRIH